MTPPVTGCVLGACRVMGDHAAHLTVPPRRGTDQSLRDRTLFDHCRVVPAPVSGPDVELRQCVGQSCHPDEVISGQPRVLEYPDRQGDLISLAAREGLDHGQEPVSRLLIPDDPLVRLEIASDVADADRLGYPADGAFVPLRDTDLDPHPEAEALLGVWFDDRHDRPVTIQKACQVSSIDFREVVSHGVNLHPRACARWLGLHRIGHDYYPGVSPRENYGCCNPPRRLLPVIPN
jgi:hypothetical protein